MNKEPINEIARQVVSRILEDAVFVFTDALEQEEKPELDTWKPEGVSLYFTGQPSGVFRLWVDNAFARIAARNMLGVELDDEQSAQRGKDALKEILNIIVGNFLTEVYGDTPVFSLGLPQPVAIEKLSDDYRAENSLWLKAEDIPMLCVFDLQS